jgi:hypothetical protein
MGHPDRGRSANFNGLTQIIGLVCLVGVIIGPTVWIADLLGIRMGSLSVRAAFIMMLGGFAGANVFACMHLFFVSRLPKQQKREWLQRFYLGFRMFASFEYLLTSELHRQPDAARSTRTR